MARPSKDPNEKYNKPIGIKFSTTDLVKLRERAKKEHIPVSTLIRKFALEGLGRVSA